MAEMTVRQGFAFHVHHDKLVEYCTSYEERKQYIQNNKPVSEQELRLRLFKLIPDDRLPPTLLEACATRDKACAAYDKAWATRDKAWAAYDKACAARGKAWATYEPALLVLHKELCPDCPWDGKTIFSEWKVLEGEKK